MRKSQVIKLKNTVGKRMGHRPRSRYFSFIGKRKDVSPTSSACCSAANCHVDRRCCKQKTATGVCSAVSTSRSTKRSSGTSSRTRRSVSFCETVQVIASLHKNDYTKQERKNTWYGNEEFGEMKECIKDILSRMVKPDGENSVVDVKINVHVHDSNDQDNCSCCCIRGLEDHVISKGRSQQKKIRAALIDAIMKGQKGGQTGNHDYGVINGELLARVSKRMSLPSTKLARRRAEFDEQDAAATLRQQ